MDLRGAPDKFSYVPRRGTWVWCNCPRTCGLSQLAKFIGSDPQLPYQWCSLHGIMSPSHHSDIARSFYTGHSSCIARRIEQRSQEKCPLYRISRSTQVNSPRRVFPNINRNTTTSSKRNIPRVDCSLHLIDFRDFACNHASRMHV